MWWAAVRLSAKDLQAASLIVDARKLLSKSMEQEGTRSWPAGKLHLQGARLPNSSVPPLCWVPQPWQ